jgi:DNA-binding response OmpR family regulator
MSETQRILVVEVSPSDADLILEMLADAELVDFQIESVPQLAAAITRLEDKGIDLVLLDRALPDSHGLETFHRLREAARSVPAIVLSGTDDQELRVAAVRHGAQDYLVKGQLGGSLLARAARYAIERRKTQEAFERTAREWQTTFDATNDAIWILDNDHRVLRSNKTAEGCFHRPCCEMLGQHCWAIVHGTTEPHPNCPSLRARQSGRRETMEHQQGERPVFQAPGGCARSVVLRILPVALRGRAATSTIFRGTL